MRALLMAALLVASSTPKQFSGVSRLAEFSGKTGGEFLAYFNNSNGVVLLKKGQLITLPLNTRLSQEKSCCEHRATPSLSHHGEKIAYVHVASERPRREAVAIYDVASGAMRDVFEAAVIWSVAWSPDDSRLAAVADEAGSKGRSLYLIRPDMGQPAEGVYLNMDIKGVEYELSNYAPPSWSNSGDRLAVELRRKGTGGGNSAAGMIGIWTPETRQLTKFADGVEPTWSPVEDEIAYFSPKRNKCVAVKAGEAQRVLFSVGKRGAGAGRGALFFPIVWSADGKQVLFHQWVDADLITDLYRLDLTTRKSKKVARSELQVVGWRSGD